MGRVARRCPTSDVETALKGGNRRSLQKAESPLSFGESSESRSSLARVGFWRRCAALLTAFALVVGAVATVFAAAVATSTLSASLAGASTPLPISSISVPGTTAWTDTGDTLIPGMYVTFSASGTVGGMLADGSPAGGPTPACLSETDSGSYGSIVDTSLPCWSLIGKYGSGGTPFEIGDTSTLEAMSGELYLGVNDNYFADN
jgi:hypothetical protein